MWRSIIVVVDLKELKIVELKSVHTFVTPEYQYSDFNLINSPDPTPPGHQYNSITELEVTQAAFLSDSQHATLYYRMQEHLDDKLAQLPESASDSERELLETTFMSENEHCKMKIHDLRQRLVKRGISVKYFRTTEELGQLVLDDWKDIIDIVLPPLMHDTALLGKYMSKCCINAFWKLVKLKY